MQNYIFSIYILIHEDNTDYIHDIKPVVNYRFELIEGPLIKGQFSQLAIGVDTSSFQFWKLDTPLINLI